MPKDVTVEPRHVVRAAQAAAEADPRVCALALDVLSRQGEGHLLFAGKDFVEARAEEHGVEEAQAEVGGQNVLDLLRGGPSDARGFALVGALAVRGLEAHLGEPDRLDRFVRHADWLCLTTPYDLYAFVEPVLEERAAPLWERVRAALEAAEGEGPAVVARRALYRSVLPEDAEGGDDEAASAEPEGELAGAIGRPPTPGWRGALRLVTGWAALQWLVRGVGWALGLRRPATLQFVKGGLRLSKRVELLGKTVREGRETYTWAALASAGRTTRYPAAHLVAGALAFAAGIVAGGLFLFDGLRSGETILLLVGAGLILLGGGLDLALGMLLPARRGRVAVDLAVLPKRRVRLVGVDESAAERFLERLARQL
ncbi:MAG TPA: hypothetical protein RMH85_08165 [Polyangiaceae bacterium LLY-WYZ-15_(1-7)]|nr:hypothetical protein [Sandaracinus sp.]HJK93518.1 hypothetical protein [Polyangiaceae bacterium LLY-WYZ-15_(1-7)]MBJ72285.1 hypothetical protein [Sandaracinus sp.]HJL03069.1 hypothetical protein [Polyangiaceae bacterium LLY-WYZ-15_(1-7)]HJL08457.1 hypothetical protein [Polyangiaceae bacterium LLY-WYZ-15_(1-7)]